MAVYFSKTPVGPYYDPLIVKTDEKGNFYISYRIPLNKPVGKYKWHAVDLKTGKEVKPALML